MADFEADKTSGTGPALVMVHPLKVNDTEADKKAILTITVNGVPKTVNLTQKKGSLNYEYKLEVDKEAINILGKGGSDTLAITSQRREMINGTPQGDWENVEVTAEFLEEPPFTAGLRFTDNEEKTLEVSITSKNTTEQAISGILTIKQVGGLTKTVTVTQAAGEVTYSYRIDPSGTTLTVPKDQITNPWEGSVRATFTGYRAKLIEGTKVSEEILPFKIPSIGETKVIDNRGIAVSYWFTDYGSIANNYQASFRATSHMRKNAGIYFQAFSASWECQFNDGGTYQINTLLTLQLV
nr:MAG: Putative binding domain, N-terminal [Bacteriophage sp.]